MKTKKQFLNELYDKIKELIIKSGLQKQDISENLGRSHSYVSVVTKDRRDSNINIISSIVHSLGKSIEFKNNKGSVLTSDNNGVFNPDEVSRFIKKHRAISRLSIEGLALRAKTTRANVIKHLSNKYDMSIYTVYKYMHILGFKMYIDGDSSVNHKGVENNTSFDTLYSQQTPDNMAISSAVEFILDNTYVSSVSDILDILTNDIRKYKNKETLSRKRACYKDLVYSVVSKNKVCNSSNGECDKLINRKGANCLTVSMGDNVYSAINGVIKLPNQPTKLSDLTNDVGYITTCDKPTILQRIKNLFKK